MNVLQIVPRLDLGGVERGVVDFSQYLIAKGHKSIVISSGGRLVDKLLAQGAVHYSLPVHKKSLVSIISSIGKVKRIILTEKVDIVHARSRVPDWIGFFASLKTPAQFIITAHGYYSQHFFSRIVSYAKYVIAPSNVIARHLIEDFGTSASKVGVIPRGLNLDDFGFLPFSSRPKEFKLCYIGRISPIKGIEYFIDAVNELVKTLPDLKAVIAGEASPKHKEYELFLKRKVAKYGLNERIEFLGRRDSSEVLASSHVLILPSLIPESFGRVVIEAQARGTLCVATDLGGPSEIIEEGLNGFLVAPCDSLGLAQKVKHIIGLKDKVCSIAAKARAQVEEKYTLELMSDKTLKVYADTLKKFNILVIKLSALGDVVLATATFKTLKKHFPKAYLTVLCDRAYFKIIEDLEDCDEVIIYEAKRSRFKELLRLSRLLRKKSFDLVFDLQNNHFSQVLSFLTLPKRSIGFKRKLSFLLDKPVKLNPVAQADPLESQKSLLAVAGISQIEDPGLSVEPSALAYIESVLKEQGLSPADELMGINIEAALKWKTKNLKPARLKELISFLVKEGFKLILVGTDKSSALAQDLRQAYPASVFDLCGATDLKQLVALMSKMRVFITPDSAPFHIASSLGVSTIGIFGPTDPNKHAVLKNNVFIIQRKFRCLCCYKKRCSDNECMDIGMDKFKPLIEGILNDERINTDHPS